MKKRIKRYIPSRSNLESNKYLGFLGKRLIQDNLWHLNRKSVARGVAIGLFCAWIPVPFQMIIAASAAIIFSSNLPIPVALVWITNPLTIPPLYYFAYWFGAKLLNSPLQNIEFQLSFDWLMMILSQIWQPFLFGCFVIGVGTAIIGYFITHWLWRYSVVKRWRGRKL